MSAFPQELTLDKSSHLLFEAGSLMLTVFGALFIVGLPVTALFSVYGIYVQPTLILVCVLGLLAANGVGLLYVSTKLPS